MGSKLAKNHRSFEDAVATPRTSPEDVLGLLKTWMEDNSGYDEETWPLLKEAIEADRLSSRDRFRD